MEKKQQKPQKAHPNLQAKKPPQNTEAEQAVLGSVMIDENAAGYLLSSLGQEDFYLQAHKTIFAAMKDLFSLNRPVDIVTVLQELENRGGLEDAGGVDYLSSLPDVVPTAANHRHWCEIVTQNSLRRKLITASDDISAEAFKGEKEDVLTFAESRIFRLGEEAGRRELIPVSEATAAAYQRMEEICKDKAAFRGIPTGLKLLDGYLNGFQKGDLIVLAARPGYGKTSLGMNFVTNAALTEVEKLPGIKSSLACAVFSVEMSSEQLARRMLCSVAKVSMSNASGGNLNANEWARLRQAKPIIDKSQIYIDNTMSITPAEIVSKCRRLKREKKLDLVLIDYLQLMSLGRAVESRQYEISEMTRTLKKAALEMGVPIILLSQLSRKPDDRKDKKPMMSDLRESGAIEQDADVILFIHKPENEAAPDVYELVIGKHRNGETGSFPIKWRGEYVTFENADT